jgi:hypothetical protein
MTAPHELKPMSCEEFQALLPKLIATGEDIHLHPHLQSCELCTALLADLQAIADAARQLFPAVEPPDELWGEIENRIKKDEASEAKHDDSENRKMAASGEDETPSAADEKEPSKA